MPTAGRRDFDQPPLVGFAGNPTVYFLYFFHKISKALCTILKNYKSPIRKKIPNFASKAHQLNNKSIAMSTLI
jgi:hypothetical protein